MYNPILKIQGGKTKILPFLQENMPKEITGNYIEPFVGGGSVGFNVDYKNVFLMDNNPHIIKLYDDIKHGNLTGDFVKESLYEMRENLIKDDQKYFYDIRRMFNDSPRSLLFIFLNRTSFNGLIRFNGKKEFNTPYGKNKNALTDSLIERIAIDIDKLKELFNSKNVQFAACDFRFTLPHAKSGDFIYLDPPYINRESTYFTPWYKEDMSYLIDMLKTTNCKWMLSTWVNYKQDENTFISSLKNFNIKTIDYYYGIGSKKEYRGGVTEAIITNYD